MMLHKRWLRRFSMGTWEKEGEYHGGISRRRFSRIRNPVTSSSDVLYTLTGWHLMAGHMGAPFARLLEHMAWEKQDK